jgi:uncharacterized RDD family membrane protein YckC
MKTALLSFLVLLGVTFLNRDTFADSTTAPIGPTTQPTSAPADLGDVLATGDEQQFWVARVIPAASAESGEIQTRVVVTHGFGSAWADLPTVPARVAAMAGSGDELLLALEGGQWMIADEADLRVGAPPPNAGKLLAVASEQTITWAIVTDNGPATRPMEPASGPATEAAIPSINPLPRRWLVYQRHAADWINGEILPAGIDAATTISMTVANQRPIIAWRNSDGVIHISDLNPDGRWNEVAQISGTGDARFAMLRADGEPILWTAASTGAGADQFAGVVHRGEDFSKTTVLKVVGNLPPAGGPQVLAVAFESLRWLAISGGDVVEQDYQIDGTPKGQVHPIDQTEPTPVDFDPYATGAALVVLVAVVAALAQRRGRPSGLWQAAQTDPVLPAPIGPRMAAAFVDLLPSFAAMWALPRGLNTAAALENAVWNIFIIAVTTYVAHTLVAELICGQSIGKMMFGLRVTTTDGKAPSAASIIVRNILRIVDVSLIVSVVLIFLTPRRQRIGDLVAGTIVVAEDSHGENEQS